MASRIFHRMSDVAIVGAGDLGGALAHALCRHQLVRKITIFDEADSVAAGKALDISQAAPIDNFTTDVMGTSNISAISTAEVIVVADPFRGGGEWNADDGLQLLRGITAMASHAIIVCAGADHRSLVERGIQEIKLQPRRVLGSAPGALVAGARALVALAVDGSARDVSLSVLGVPPAHIVICWESATIAGSPLNALIAPHTQREIGRRIVALWPPGPRALAAAAVEVVAALLGNSRRSVTCFAAGDGLAGARRAVIALPTRLGPSGIVEVLVPALSVAERVALGNAVEK